MSRRFRDFPDPRLEDEFPGVVVRGTSEAVGPYRTYSCVVIDDVAQHEPDRAYREAVDEWFAVFVRRLPSAPEYQRLLRKVTEAYAGLPQATPPA